MLGKMIKYDLKALSRYLLPLYAVLIGSSVGLRICIEISSGFGTSALGVIISALFGFTYFLSIFATIGGLFIILAIHYNKSLLTEQGYFFLTLPVSFDAHLLGKILSGAVFSLASVLAVFVSSLPMLLGNVELPEIVRFLSDVLDFVREMFMQKYGVLIVIFWLINGLIGTQIMIYFCITVGSLFKRRKTFGAFLVFLGQSLVTNILSACLSVNRFTNIRAVSAMFNENAAISTLVLESSIFYFVIFALEYFGARAVLKNKLNLE